MCSATLLAVSCKRKIDTRSRVASPAQLKKKLYAVNQTFQSDSLPWHLLLHLPKVMDKNHKGMILINGGTFSIRGGSFLCNDSYCSGYRVARRMKSTEDSGMEYVGFRCVENK